MIFTSNLITVQLIYGLIGVISFAGAGPLWGSAGVIIQIHSGVVQGS